MGRRGQNRETSAWVGTRGGYSQLKNLWNRSALRPGHSLAEIANLTSTRPLRAREERGEWESKKCPVHPPSSSQSQTTFSSP